MRMLFFCELYVIRDELALLGRTAHMLETEDLDEIEMRKIHRKVIWQKITQQSAGAGAGQPNHEQQQHPLSNDLYLRQQRQQPAGAGAEQPQHHKPRYNRTSPQPPVLFCFGLFWSTHKTDAFCLFCRPSLFFGRQATARPRKGGAACLGPGFLQRPVPQPAEGPEKNPENIRGRASPTKYLVC